MEIHRPSTSMRIPPRPSYDARRPPNSRNSSFTSTTSSRSRDPMPIPGASVDIPPPPLPPPRYNEELERGIDTAWTWSNGGMNRELAPIKPGSSLYGGYLQDESNTRRSSGSDEMDLDDCDRRRSHASTARTPSSSHVFLGAGGPVSHSAAGIPSLVRRPASPNPSNQRLVPKLFPDKTSCSIIAAHVRVTRASCPTGHDRPASWPVTPKNHLNSISLASSQHLFQL